jgi:hypothetical protein
MMAIARATSTIIPQLRGPLFTPCLGSEFRRVFAGDDVSDLNTEVCHEKSGVARVLQFLPLIVLPLVSEGILQIVDDVAVPLLSDTE